MAFPVGAIADSYAAEHGNKSNGLRTQRRIEIETFLENRNKILNYLKETFDAEIFFEENHEMNATMFILKFKDIDIGISLDDAMIISVDVVISCRHAYDLVWVELDKTKMKYVKE